MQYPRFSIYGKNHNTHHVLVEVSLEKISLRTWICGCQIFTLHLVQPYYKLRLNMNIPISRESLSSKYFVQKAEKMLNRIKSNSNKKIKWSNKHCFPVSCFHFPIFFCSTAAVSVDIYNIIASYNIHHSV